MSYFKALSGTWSETDEVYKGIIDSSETARCIRGSESDEKYEVRVTAKINAGKAAVIVLFTYSDDWEERYVELVLDAANDKVTLDGVIRNDDGSEKTRSTLASHNMTIDTDTEYELRVVTKVLSDGSGAAYGYVDKFQAVYAEDLASTYTAGMHGFECLGSEDEYSTFEDFRYVTSHNCAPSDVRRLVDTALEDEDIEELIETADDDLDNLLDGASMSSALKKASSMRLTACLIVENQPQSLKMGGISMNYGDRAKRWRKWVNLKVAKSVGRWHTVDALED